MADRVTRRSVVGVLGVGALSAALAAFSAEQQASPGGITLPQPPGRSRLPRWTIFAVHPIEDGAFSVVVSGENRRKFTLDVMARDPSPLAHRAPAETAELAIFVRNRGNGWQQTHEEEGLAAMALANYLSSRGRTSELRGLQTLSERIAMHPALTTDEPGHMNPAPRRQATAVAEAPASDVESSPAVHQAASTAAA